MGRYKLDRNPLPAISLTVDTSAITAIGNDYGYEHVFSRQLSGIAIKTTFYMQHQQVEQVKTLLKR